ncbi:MAG: hypothetical protein JKY27_10370 [Magnetovibrio sp.]|nr:hypothetical protein [Magnetovibrio sp.]
MDIGMTFELTLRLLFGEKATHIANQEGDPKARQQWLTSAVKRMYSHVNQLDTHPQHQKMLLSELDHINQRLDIKPKPSWELVYSLFRLCFRLLGSVDLKGRRDCPPTYRQSDDQNHPPIKPGGDQAQLRFDDKRDAASIRQKLVQDLQDSGFDDDKIGQVLNLTNAEVKKFHLQKPN